MLQIGKLYTLLLILGSFVSNNYADESIITPEYEQLVKYLQKLAEKCSLDFNLIATRATYFSDATEEEIVSAAFSSKAKENDLYDQFDVSTLSKGAIKKLVKEAEDQGIILSLLEETVEGDTRIDENFETESVEISPTPAINSVLDEQGFEAGLDYEISTVMDLTDEIAIVQVIEYFDNGGIKRNTTTTVFPYQLQLVDAYKMSAKMKQTASELIKKAYKVDIEDRTPLIADLFTTKFPKYSWQVFLNVTDVVVNKDTLVNFIIGNDDYKIFGTKI